MQAPTEATAATVAVTEVVIITSLLGKGISTSVSGIMITLSTASSFSGGTTGRGGSSGVIVGGICGAG
jgi:hypothetical protein